MPSRDESWDLLCEWTQGDALRKHGRAVEGAVGWYAEHRFGKSGEELDTWRSAGLLHDFDYERFPDQHPLAGADELRTRGYPEELVQAVLGHGVRNAGAGQNRSVHRAQRGKDEGEGEYRDGGAAEA